MSDSHVVIRRDLAAALRTFELQLYMLEMIAKQAPAPEPPKLKASLYHIISPRSFDPTHISLSLRFIPGKNAAWE